MRQCCELKTIGTVCKVIAGQSPEGKFYNDNGNGLPFYQGKKEYGEKYIGEPTTWTTKVTKEAEANDILMSVRAPVGPINFATQKICIGRGLAAIRATKLIDKEFLFNFLLKHESEIVGNTGAVFNSINKAQIEAIEIPLPPLPEQERIVTILDEAFGAIAKAKENAEQNLKNAKELFESYLQGVFKNNGDGWEEKTLGEIASFSQGIQVGLEQHLTEPKTGYVRFIRIVDYTQNTEDIRYVPDPGEKYFVKEDDIVMVRYGTPGLIGRGKAGVIANNLFKITIENNALSKDFLCLCLSQKHIQTYLSTQGSATMPALNFGQLNTVSINFPSLKEQTKIVEKLDSLSTETKKLEAIYQQKINDLEELKKSVLQKAFSGELKTNKLETA